MIRSPHTLLWSMAAFIVLELIFPSTDSCLPYLLTDLLSTAWPSQSCGRQVETDDWTM